MSSFPRMIWFDLDDTLYDHSHSVGLGMRRVGGLYPVFSTVPVSELVLRYNQALNQVYPDYLLGKIDFAEMRRRKFDLFLRYSSIATSDAPDVTTFHRLYDEGYGTDRRPTPGSVEAVQRLIDDGIEVAVLTNGNLRVQEEKLRKIGFASLVPNLLTSEQAGATKPDPAIFHWALRQTQRTAGEVVMIGDNLLNDIEGALGVGMRAFYYAPSSLQATVTTPAGPAPVITIWEQLPDCLYNDSSAPRPLEVLPS